MTSVRTGDLLAGKYRVEDVLGEGAMGVVVAANHIELNKRVAVKFMKLDAIPGQAGIERFMREARAAARLQTEHVCHVFDVGRLEGGSPYIVMELLKGEDLHTLFSRSGPLSQAAAAGYVLQVCEAMAEAHDAGIVHRDLKPQNLFVTRTSVGRERIKVLDFGVSKVQATTDLIQTNTAAVMGTPAYMSPEQLASSKHVDGRADIWSIGVILYELVTGVLPFRGDDFMKLAISIVQDTPRSPRQLRSELEPEFEAVVLRCLQKEREQRFASATELADALRPFVEVRLTANSSAAPRESSQVAATLPLSPPQTTLSAAASQVDASAPKRRSWLLGGGAVAVLGVGAIAFAFATREGDAGQSVAPMAAPAPERSIEQTPLAPPPIQPPVPAPMEAVIKPPVVPEPVVKDEPKLRKDSTVRVEADKIKANEIRAKKIVADEIEAKRINAEKIKADRIKADEIKTKELDAETIIKDSDVFRR